VERPEEGQNSAAFPLLSGICCVFVLLSFAVPMFVSGAWHPPARDASSAQTTVYYGFVFLSISRTIL